MWNQVLSKMLLKVTIYFLNSITSDFLAVQNNFSFTLWRKVEKKTMHFVPFSSPLFNRCLCRISCLYLIFDHQFAEFFPPLSRWINCLFLIICQWGKNDGLWCLVGLVFCLLWGFFGGCFFNFPPLLFLLNEHFCDFPPPWCHFLGVTKQSKASYPQW